MKHSNAAVSSSTLTFREGFLFYAFRLFVFSIFLLTVLLFAIWIKAAYDAYSQEKMELASLQAEYEKLRAESERNEQVIKKLYQDEYIELVARQKLHMVKPGEKAYVVVMPESEELNSEDIIELLSGP